MFIDKLEVFFARKSKIKEKTAKVHFFSKVQLSLTLDNSVNTTPNDIMHTRQ